MEETTQTTDASAEKRPVFLTVLCILSFIAAGLGILGYITAITAMGAMSSMSTEGLSPELSATMNDAMSKMPSAGMTWAYVIVGFATTLISLFGVIKMWKLQKVGFFIYVAAAVIGIIMGIIYSGFGVMGVVFPAIFIVLYGLNLKAMK